MRFRLVYTGEIKASQNAHPANGVEKHVAHKHNIRKHFHQQLRRLWTTDKFLSEHRVDPAAYGVDVSASQVGAFWGPDPNNQIALSAAVANLYQEHSYRFVPLVREQWFLTCSLRILFLRQDGVNTTLHSGDIDNRVKTIIDALTKPSHAAHLQSHPKPNDDEDPFYCLLENDRLVTGLQIETDTLLTPPTGNSSEGLRQASIVVSVEVRPTYVTNFNLSFAS